MLHRALFVTFPLARQAFNLMKMARAGFGLYRHVIHIRRRPPDQIKFLMGCIIIFFYGGLLTYIYHIKFTTTMLHSDLEKMSIEELQQLYIVESDKLHQCLLEGVSWMELKDQRKVVSAIGVIIDLKLEIYSKVAEGIKK